ncbi:Integrase catalytic domain-containing protein [Meloidogyne graminicola]|uniref:Integrase catalytic domain-containing protein n=1 Tax=Meloidogyne graminicola TaxID=189291 RepID=A0A8S9ZS20_9BILA|nr:Integrase catalytic domain-containing protein [Meloidogyne graminicola]
MPSSGPIRSQLGPALKTLKVHITAATALLRAGADRDLEQLKGEHHHLSRTLERVESLNEKWSNFIDRLEGEALEAEERIYQEFPPQSEDEADQPKVHFMELAEQANRIIGEVEYLLVEFEERAISQTSQRTQLTVGSNQKSDQGTHQVQGKDDNQQPTVEQPTRQPQANQQPINQGPQGNHGQPDIRLPQLRLDPFTGDPKTWPTFWQLFSINIDQRPLDNISKMSYLLTFLQGPPKDLIAGFVLSNENYVRALDLLKSRYGDNRAITEALEAELMNLPHANESSHSLRSFVDNIERICRQLEAYGHSDASPFVSTAIKSKLPHQIVAKLVEKERGSGLRWNCTQLRKELRELVEIREEVQRCTTVTRSKPEGNHHPMPRAKPHPKGGSPEITRSFAAPAIQRKDQRRSIKGPRKCSLCDVVGHFPSQCPKYPSPHDRFCRLREQKRCIRCLREGHFVKECPSFNICGQCQGGHHILVCTKNRPTSNFKAAGGNKGHKQAPYKQITQIAAGKESTPATGANQIKALREEEKEPPDKLITSLAYSHLRKKPTAYLMTRKIAIASSKDPEKEIPVYVFFDPGSHLSYITEPLVKYLRPPQVSQDYVKVHGFGGTQRDPVRIRSPSYAISIQREDGEWEELELNWTKEISTSFEMASWVAEMPAHATQVPEVKRAIELATEVPGVMLGTRHFWKYFMGKTEVAPGLFVIQTAFGPVIGGESDMSPQGGKLSHSLVAVGQSSVDQMPPANAVEEFWSLESIGIRENPATDDDQLAINQLKKAITRDQEGRYTVSWLWREPRVLLPSNYRMAFSRLCSTYSNLQRSEELLEKYNKVFLDYLKQGIIEPAKRNPEGQEHYLAHHAVITHKIRPVFDASAHPRGQPSLNECLLRGPVLLPELAGLLIRFRQPKFVAISDIESAFLMVGLHPVDREVAKFMWVKDLSKPPTASVAAELANSLYVDNLHLGAEEWPELLEKCQKAKEIFQHAKMNLREFSSNSAEMMEAIPEKDRFGAKEPKVLGMRWNIDTDRLYFQLPTEFNQKITSRRAVLSSLAGIYDPLGLLSPSVLPAKLFFQRLWDDGHDWDSPLSQEETAVWETFLLGWQNSNISIPRRALPHRPEQTEIHTFVDASSCAYAAAVYLRSLSQGDISTSLIFSKNRLKPKKGGKTLTIPRMELIAILIGSGPFIAEDYVLAEKYLIRWEQIECSEELNRHKQIIDDQKIIRLQTRIINSQSPAGLINQFFSRKNSVVGKVLITYIHQKLCHGGVDWTLTEYLNQYWQPKARQTVRRVISECRVCRRMNSYKYALPEMPPFPADRVQQRRPFQSIGVDYAGPTLTKVSGALVKCWLVLITCLTTRAVYLEPTLDLTAISFVNVFRRFVSRRGRPERILSDNGRNFVLAEKAISSALASRLAEERIEWKFIPALSPWAGGIYERMIGLAKSCFKRTLGKQILPYDQLSTFVAEVEAVLNSRPITHVSDGEGAPLPLRPIDFIQPGSILKLEPVGKKIARFEHLPPHEQLLSHWKGTLENLDALWSRWRKEYLVLLRDNSKWEHVAPRLKTQAVPRVDDVVLVEEAMQPRNTWSLARIVKLNGEPGPIRSVRLLMPNGRITTRPINRIYPLEAGPKAIEQENLISTESPEAEITPLTRTPTSALNSPPFEEEAEEDPPPQREIRKKIVEEGGEPDSKHRMTTRGKARRAAASVMLLAFLSLLVTAFASGTPVLNCTGCPTCQGCLIHCNKQGVKILAPEKITKVQVCCADQCHLLPGRPEIDHALPKEMLLNDYECQPNSLLIKDKGGQILGAITLTLRALTLVCNPKTLAFLRSYQINTRSVWRCPTSGSCSGSFCSQVGPNTHIPELVEAMDKVGVSECLESSAVWSSGCGLPTASCHFYRWYAVPMSLDVYELFECPTWDFHIKAELAVTVNDFTLEESLTLIPGWTHHGKNISLTPIAVTNPPAPILGIPFLTHGFSVALGKDVPLDLKCPDLPSARGFGCNISEEACRDCRHATGGTVTCQCREFDAEAILANPEARLPLTVGRHTLLTEDDQVYVEQTYTPIQIHIQMENFQLISQITESTCIIDPKEIKGCYKCLKGVQVEFTCTTSLEYEIEWPRRGEAMSHYLTRKVQNLSSTFEISPRRRAEGMLYLFWENLKYKGKGLPSNAEPLLSLPARITEIEPGVTVEEYFYRKGEPLEHPKLPCLVLKGGVRGSSKRSRQRARATGRKCWKYGELHEEYLPLEGLIYEPEIPVEDFEQGREESPPQDGHPPSESLPSFVSSEEKEEKDAIRVIIPRSWRPLKITIIIDNKNTMPKRGIAAQEKRELKRARQQAYISTFGVPMSPEEEEEMEKVVNSMEEIPPPREAGKMGGDNSEGAGQGSPDPQQLSANILPINTQIINALNSAPSQQPSSQIKTTESQAPSTPPPQQPVPLVATPQKIDNSKQQPIGETATKIVTTKQQLTTTTKPTIQYELAAPVKEKHEDGFDERLREALLSCILKLSENSPLASSPALPQEKTVPSNVQSTSAACIVPPAQPSVPYRKPPVVELVPIPLNRVGTPIGGREQEDPRRPPPYQREPAGIPVEQPQRPPPYSRNPITARGPIRPLPDSRSAQMEDHLRSMRLQAEQLSRTVGIAVTDWERQRRDDQHTTCTIYWQ